MLDLCPRLKPYKCQQALAYNPNRTINTTPTGSVTLADDSETRVIRQIDGRLCIKILMPARVWVLNWVGKPPITFMAFPINRLWQIWLAMAVATIIIIGCSARIMLRL